MLELLEVVLLGICEGITEWLPISSTGHMLLLYQLFHIDEKDPFWAMFLVVIQFGAILAVVLIYFKSLWPFRRPDPETSGAARVRSVFRRDKLIMWLKILVSCVPAAIVGLTVDDWIELHLYNYVTVAVMLIAYGAAGLWWKCLYAGGAVLFLVAKLFSPYKGSHPRIKRLSRIETWSALFFCAAAFFLFYNGNVCRDSWAFTIAGGFLLAFTTIAIPRVVNKELKKNAGK